MYDFDAYKRGYVLVKPGLFPYHNELVSSAIHVIKDSANSTIDVSGANKPYFVNILLEEHLKVFPLLAEFALIREVRDIVTNLLGHTIMLQSIGIYYTRPGYELQGSMKWHTDGDEKFRQVKLFMNLHPTPLEGGATEFIPRDKTAIICNNLMKEAPLTNRTLRWFEVDKVDDEIMNKHLTDTPLTIAGEPGRGVFLNSTECFHRGGRTAKTSRYMFVAQFICSVDKMVPKALNQPGRAIGNFHILERRYTQAAHRRIFGFPDWRKGVGGPDEKKID